VTDPHRQRVELDDTLAFINTLPRSIGGEPDQLPSLEVALDWLVSHGLASPVVLEVERGWVGGPGRTSAARLAGIHRVRDALARTADAIVEGRPADAEALEVLNRSLRSREVLCLEPSTDGVAIGEREAEDPIGEGLARLVEPLAELVASGRKDRLRVCGDETCRWVFYDDSRAGRRVWCNMATCGNRAKARRYRERKREHGEPRPASL
jgi:predicted RNA-binding Zn ribbon-like protein